MIYVLSIWFDKSITARISMIEKRVQKNSIRVNLTLSSVSKDCFKARHEWKWIGPTLFPWNIQLMRHPWMRYQFFFLFIFLCLFMAMIQNTTIMTSINFVYCSQVMFSFSKLIWQYVSWIIHFNRTLREHIICLWCFCDVHINERNMSRTWK